METSRLKPLSILYMKYTARHRGQPPTNEQVFKQFIQSEGGSLLSIVDGDVEQLFISERDGKPFAVQYQGPQGPQGIIAYEQQGVGGERLVAGSMGNVMTLDEAQFQQMLPADE